MSPCARGRRCGMRARKEQAGMALLSVLIAILVLSLLGGLVLYLSGQESQLSTVRYRAAQSLNIAEGGAWAARAALMAVLNADPTDAAQFTADISSTVPGWYAGGNRDLQNALAFLTYLQVDGQPLGVSAPERSDAWVVFRVNWSRPTPRLKLEFVAKGSGVPPDDPLSLGTFPQNPVGDGAYRAAVVLMRRSAEHPSCAPQRANPPFSECFIHLNTETGPAAYTIPLEYRIVADGQVDPAFRRRVSLQGKFGVVISRRSFAEWLSFTDVFSRSDGTPVYYYVTESLDGPVHTNGRFRFWGFPKFGTPDVGSPCDEGRVQATRLTSTDTVAVFRRLPGRPGSPVEVTLEANEWVEGGQRVAAPVLPDCTPSNFDDDSDNRPAQFQRGFDGDPNTPGIQPITVPPNSFNQRAIALGWDPGDPTPNGWSDSQWNRRIRSVVPELADGPDPVPPGIYVPVADTNRNSVSDSGEPLAGGVYVEGDLRSLRMYPCGPNRDLACYHFVHTNEQEVTVTVDRENNQTTVTNSAWPPGSRTRTFTGVPKGYQGTSAYRNAMIIYVHGNLGTGGPDGLSGQLEEKEQTLITVRGNVYITGHLRYERPPNPYDPSDNPLNLLGVFTPLGSLRITPAAPENLDLHGVFMAGQPGVSDGVKSELLVENVCSLPNKGELRLLGGMILEYAGVTGCVVGGGVRGYSEHSVYDRRMSRGFSPPYFPTTLLPAIRAEGLAGAKPQWREGSPP
ncbi:MAG: hypothetical protein C4303_06455 [candidate division GAL15 bacterium]